MKDNKNLKCWGVRNSLAGDLIFALPILNYLELKYHNSYKYWCVAKKCAGFIPLFYNHPLIDCIRVVDNEGKLSQEDLDIIKDCSVVLDITPQHPYGLPGTTPESCWWNFRNVYEETFLMAGFDLEEYRKMPDFLQKPKLYPWFDINKEENSIGIWAFSSYGSNSKRSPSFDWWYNFIKILLENTNYNIYQFGSDKDPYLWMNNPRFIYLNNLPIFDQIKKSISLSINISTNSGSGAILGAYGVNQITLLTDDAPNHYQNFLAFSFLNWYDRNINLFEKGGCDNIKFEDVIKVINKLK